MAHLQNAGAEDHHHRSSSMMSSTRSPLPPNTLGRLRHWTWPSQAYHCSFCTRVFRTAQALGGHMNIHRRERACIPTTATTTRPPPHLLPPPRPALSPTHLHLSPFTGPRPSCNGGNGKLNLVADPAPTQPFSDSLTWLFSQLPPPGMQGSNMRSNVVKPYHRGLALCKSPPGVRRHVCRIHTASPAAAQRVVYTGLMQSRSRGLEKNDLERISSGGVDHVVRAPEESVLDLELRL